MFAVVVDSLPRWVVSPHLALCSVPIANSGQFTHHHHRSHHQKKRVGHFSKSSVVGLGAEKKNLWTFLFFVCALTIDPPRGSRFRRREKKRGPECVVWSVPSRSSRIRFGGVDVPTTTELGGEGEEWSSHFCEISDLLRNLSCWPRPRSDCGGHGPGKMVQD